MAMLARAASVQHSYLCDGMYRPWGPAPSHAET